MRNESLVSAIIIFLNGEKFIQEAIESVFAQTYDNWELLLVDDGSTDQSTEIALRYAEQYPGQIQYLMHEGHQNRGMSASRNLGLRHAKGEYIALLDHDDIWLPNKLEDQVAILEARPEAGMMYGRTRFWYSWTGRPEDRERDRFTNLGIQPNTLVMPPHLVTLFLRDERTVTSICSTLIRREVAERVGGFDEDFRDQYEDHVFWTKVYLETPVFVADGCWDCYRQHPDNSAVIAIRAGQWHPNRPNHSRELYLNRVEQIVSERGIADAELWDALRTELRPYRYPEERSPGQKYSDICMDSGLALMRGEDARLLLRRLGDLRNPELDGQAVAEYIFEAGKLYTFQGPDVWAELWPRLKQRIEEFLGALEKQAQASGLARQALRALENMIERKWSLRVAGGNVAKLVYQPDDLEGVRIAIEKVQTETDYDIQLNQLQLKVTSNNSYRVQFRARSDRPRGLSLGFAQAHEPWNNLGLYKDIWLTTEWQSFQEEFMAKDDDNARIHFDAGGSDISVELSGVVLLALPDGQPIEPVFSSLGSGEAQGQSASLAEPQEHRQGIAMAVGSAVRQETEQAPSRGEVQFGALKIDQIQIQTTSHCNARCVICPHHTLSQQNKIKHGTMSSELFDKIILDAKENNIRKIIPYLMAEPLMDKDIVPRLHRIRELYPDCFIEFSTNGALLDQWVSREISDIKIDEFRVSVVGQNPRETMRINHDKVVENVCYFRSIKHPETDIKIVVLDRADGQLWLRKGFRITRWDITSRAGNIGNKVKKTSRSHCVENRESQWLHVLWDGELTLCCMTYQREASPGNLAIQSIQDVLNSQRYKDIVYRVHNMTDEEFPCDYCEWSK